MEAKTEIHFIRLVVMRSVCWTSSWSSIATAVFVYLCSPGIPQEVGLNSVSFLWFTQAWMEFALTAIHVFCLFFFHLRTALCPRLWLFQEEEHLISEVWLMSVTCEGGAWGWSYSHLIALILLSVLLLFENHPLHHLSPKVKCFTCLGRFLIVYLNSKGESMQVNSNRDCPVIFPQVLSNVFSRLFKNGVNITKQFIPRKLII